MPAIGKTIKILRAKNGIKQKDLAKKLDITVNYLSLIENDKREPRISLIENIAKELNVPISYLFWEAYEKPANLPKGQEQFFDIMKELLEHFYELSIKDRKVQEG